MEDKTRAFQGKEEKSADLLKVQFVRQTLNRLKKLKVYNSYVNVYI